MADSQTTRIRVADATQIKLITLLINAQQDADALRALIGGLVANGTLPAHMNGPAIAAADALFDLDGRLQAILPQKGERHAA
jgi:hypothetical protein